MSEVAVIASGLGLLVALAAGCMVCHGELVRLRPPAERLTEFYLALAVGGSFGGIFVAIAAPVIVGLAAVGALTNEWSPPTRIVGWLVTLWIGSLLLLLTWWGRVAIPVERERDTSLVEVTRSRDRLALLGRAGLGEELQQHVVDGARTLHHGHVAGVLHHGLA